MFLSPFRFLFPLALGSLIVLSSLQAQIKPDGSFRLKKKNPAPLQPQSPSPKASVEAPASTQFREFDVAPQTLNLDSVHAWISYPEAAQKQGLEGKVIVEVLVSSQGRYMRHQVLSSTAPVFTNAVEKRIRHLRFLPAELAGKKVTAWTQVPFRFQLFR